MMKTSAFVTVGLPLVALMLLSACGEGLRPYRGDPNTVIARGGDTGRDSGLLVDGEAAIVYDPDGCQNWIIDDGIEGYSSPRFDPKTGLPVCNNLYPPGTVVGGYQTKSAGFPDFVPRQTR
jgi:hypothetical protein